MNTVYIVLQMGKVGSWTIVQSIRHARTEIGYSGLQEAGTDGDTVVHSHSAPNVREWLGQRPKNVNVCIINAVRDPLQRCISAFFQNFANPKHKTSDRRFLYVGTEQEILGMPTEMLVEHFRKKVLWIMPSRMELFTVRFGQAIDQDPYMFQFDGNGLAHGKFEAGNFYVMRLHRFPDAIPELGKHLGLNLSDIVSGNIGKEKWYATKYKEFLSLIRPTPSEIAMYYDAPFARAYFTPEELSEFRAAWTTR